MANPYAGLNKLANKQYKATNKAVQNYYTDSKQNIKNTTNQTVKELGQKRQGAWDNATAEGRAANIDYLKSINPYGAGADAQASGGLGNSGYSETTRAANYNSMQNRVATARNTAQQAMQEYDNQIAQARNSQNEQLATLAYNTMTTKANNLNNLLGNRTNIANGAADYKLGKANYKLAKKELDFNISQAKKANASSGSSGKSGKSGKSSGKKSSGGSRKSTGSSGKSSSSSKKSSSSTKKSSGNKARVK